MRSKFTINKECIVWVERNEKVVSNVILAGGGLLRPSCFGDTINRHSPACKVHDSDAFHGASGGCADSIPGKDLEVSHFTVETGHIRKSSIDTHTKIRILNPRARGAFPIRLCNPGYRNTPESSLGTRFATLSTSRILLYSTVYMANEENRQKRRYQAHAEI
jgi:hypothetical protein